MADTINLGKGAKSFEELRVFQSARSLCNEIWKVTRSAPASKDFAFTNQSRRAAMSILSNIAEGFERNSRKEFAQFLSIAKGSCGEVRAQLLLALDQGYIPDRLHKQLQTSCIELSRGIAKLAEYLREHPRISR